MSTEIDAIDIPQSFRKAPLTAAMGDVAHLKAILQEKPDMLTIKDEVNCDPLAWSSRNGHQGVVSFLLEMDGTDIESKSFGGLRALHHAVNNNEEAIIKVLLQRGCDPNAPDDTGNTPLHYACRRGVMSIIQLLRERKADLFRKNNAGMTLLHVAANNGHLSVVQWLLKHDLDPNATSISGCTPLHVAVSAGFPNIVSALLAAGARLQANKGGKKPTDLPTSAEILALLPKPDDN